MKQKRTLSKLQKATPKLLVALNTIGVNVASAVTSIIEHHGTVTNSVVINPAEYKDKQVAVKKYRKLLQLLDTDAKVLQKEMKAAKKEAKLENVT
jgi:hypothetical protein